MADELAQQQKRDNTQIAFAAITGGIALIASAAFPLITYLVISGIAISLFVSIRKWQQAADLEHPVAAISLETPAKIFIGAFVALVGLAFVQFSAFPQMVLCTAAAAGLGGYFVNQCVLGSQASLNEALRNAAAGSDVDAVTELLRRGADPFAPDNTGNTAFHLAVRDDARAPEVLKILQGYAELPRPTLRNFWSTSKGFFSDTILQNWKLTWQRFVALFGGFTPENRIAFYMAGSDLLNSYVPPFSESVEALTAYLRSEMRYPLDINQKNNGQEAPCDLIATLRINGDLRNQILQPLQALGGKPSKQENVDQEEVDVDIVARQQDEPRPPAQETSPRSRRSSSPR